MDSQGAVSYLVPTSNHNSSKWLFNFYTAVSYLVPTSNHNLQHKVVAKAVAVSYLVPTSNHNSQGLRIYTFSLYLI